MKRKIIIIPLVIVFVLILALPSAIFVTMAKNNIILYLFANQLYDLPLPADTVVVMKEKRVGQLGGSRDYIGFWAVMEIKTPMTAEELTAYYSNKTIKSANEVTFFKLKPPTVLAAETPADWKNIPIKVIQKRQAHQIYGAKRPYIETPKVDDSIDENLLIIQILDSVYDPGWDIRGYT